MSVETHYTAHRNAKASLPLTEVCSHCRYDPHSRPVADSHDLCASCRLDNYCRACPKFCETHTYADCTYCNTDDSETEEEDRNDKLAEESQKMTRLVEQMQTQLAGLTSQMHKMGALIPTDATAKS